MKTHTTVLLCLMLTLALLCCACGSSAAEEKNTEATGTPAPTEDVQDTPEQIVEKMLQALEATPCTRAELVTDMQMTLDAGDGEAVEARVINTSDITLCPDPASGLTVNTASTQIDDETYTSVTEAYSVPEDGAMVSYVHADGIWMKMSTGMTPEQFTASSANVSVDAANAAVDESVTEWEGKPAICLTTTLTGDALDELLSGIVSGLESEEGDAAEAADLLDSMDYSALKCEARIYLDPETYLPMAEEMAFEGMTEVVAPIYADAGVSVEVTDCTAVGTFASFEPQAEIQLPQGAENRAEAWMRSLNGVSDNGDGSYSIREGAALADVTALEGFEVDEAGYDHVYFLREEDYRQVGYSVWYVTGTTDDGDDYFYGMIDDIIPDYQELGYDVDAAAGSYPAETFEYNCYLLSLLYGDHEDAEAYAWAPIGSDEDGNYYLFIEIYDGYTSEDGDSKNADLDEEDFLTYLNSASLSWLMVE